MNVQYNKPTDLFDKIRQNNYSYTYSYSKKITETDDNVEKLQDKAKAFQKNVKKLKRYSPGGISKDMLEDQIEDLVKSYNTMKNSSDKVTDKDSQKQLTKLEKLFSDNEKALKKIGVTKTDGKYAFNIKTFEDATDKDINTLFVGYDSFIGKADRIMRKLEETTDDAQYNVVEYKLSSTLKYKESDIVLAANMTLAGNTTEALKASNNLVQSANTDKDIQDIQESIETFLTNFAQSVYRTDAATENETVQKLNQLCLDNKDKLAKLGLNFDDEEKNLFFNTAPDNKIDITTSDFRNAYNELFGENATFGTQIAEYCKDIFNTIIQPDKIGVTILDEQA